MGTPHVFLRWNPNNVPTTCKPTIKGLASRYVHWSFVKKPKIDGFEKNQKREIEVATVSLYYILVIHKVFDFMSLFSLHSDYKNRLYISYLKSA